MANPRKFSDKLEIIRRKEEEANAAFVKIMREVSDARKTTGPPLLPPQNNWGRNPNEQMMRQQYKGGSLPNVNMSQNPMSMQSVFPPGMNDMYGPRQPRHQQPPYMGGITPAHMRRTMEPPSGPIYPSKNKARSHTVNAAAPYRSNIHHQSPANLIPEQHESAGSMWRRTYSDSALHQSVQQPLKKNGNGLSSQGTPPRVIHTSTLPTVDASNESPQYRSSPPGSLTYNTESLPNNGKNVQVQANTSSLPDLSNITIQSPIQNPIDIENSTNDVGKTSQSANQNEQQQPQQLSFQVPYRVPPRRTGKQIYPRQIVSNPDMLDTLQREQKLHVSLYPGGPMNPTDKNEMSLPNMANNSISHSAPLSPVTPPPYYWNTTPMSPLATGDMMQQVSAQNELQQQMQQFQIHSEQSGPPNGMGNPPPYPYNMSEGGENGPNYNNYTNYINNKQNVYRMNSGPAQLTTTNSQDGKLMCDRQLESELRKIKAQDNNHELSEADLNSVRVALDPLDFNDVQILTDENTELVDQSAEESFRLERAGYQ